MGGPIAQLVWRRHRSRVDGLVLCATAARFASSAGPSARLRGLGGLAMASRLTPPAVQRRFVTGWCRGARRAGPSSGRANRCAATTSLPCSRRRGRSASFSSTKWIGSIDVPTAVVVTDARHARLATTPAGAGFGDRRRDRAPGRRGSRCRRVRGRPLRARAARRVRVGGVAVTGAWVLGASRGDRRERATHSSTCVHESSCRAPLITTTSACGISPARAACTFDANGSALLRNEHRGRRRDRAELVVSEGLRRGEPERVVPLRVQRHAHHARVLEHRTGSCEPLPQPSWRQRRRAASASPTA